MFLDCKKEKIFRKIRCIHYKVLALDFLNFHFFFKFLKKIEIRVLGRGKGERS